MDNRMNELIDILIKAENCYYNDDESFISDLEYDKLYDELKILEKSTGVILENSPTQNVQSFLVDKLTKVEHVKPMLSLQKTKNVEELVAFSENEKCLFSYKIDGLTVVLTYENGKLIQGATRGTGVIGEDITHNVRVFENVPKEISYKGRLVLRGEAIITFEDFIKINDEIEANGGELYKNPRNLCSGSVRQLDSRVAKKRKVKLIAFGIVECDEKFKLKSEELLFLKNEKFEIVPYYIVDKSSVSDTVELFKEKILDENYATDGLVLTFDDLSYSQSKGQTSKFPHDSIAFKWSDELKETTLLEIIWSPSRIGSINPIAHFEPVELEGTTVERASLHNLSILEQLELGINDKILVYKANMIIPQVSENLTKSNNIVIPDKCPTCSKPTTIVKNKDTKTLHCTNKECPSKILNKFTHFVSRDAMNIVGLSKSTLTTLLENELIYDFTSLYELFEQKDKLLELPKFKEKKVNNLLSSIEDSKNVSIVNLIYALGINGIGHRNSKLLVDELNIKSFESLYELTYKEVSEIKGYGEVMAKSFIEYFKSEEDIKICNKLIEYLDIKYLADISEDNYVDLKAKGEVFVITGETVIYKNKKELGTFIESIGGEVGSSVTKSTTYLISNNKESITSKSKKAKSLGIPIISEEEFLELFK